MEAIYRIDGNHITTSPYAAGPWDLTMQHGSPPSALVAFIAESIPTAQPMQIVRLTIDLMRPVPVAPLTFETEVIRDGRKIQLCAVRLLAEGVVVVSATVLKMRIGAQTLPDEIEHPPIDVPPPEQGQPLRAMGDNNPFVSCVSIREVHGGFLSLGPGAIWYRMDRPIVEGHAISPVMRAAVAADFSNATSAVLDFKEWTFINADLSINLARPPIGEWVLLNSEMWISPDGAGIASSKLGDLHGYFGRAVQSLVIEKR
ncbi:thioesterase superfamily protein [Rhodopseudomonas faecalis]|uniref:Thioesterase superfamily protein n=1 Tax=Rhodopseudomonas faecalis TaxID=99655 RepID=A0A318TL33_9BRAD|nr:thioesterase family protein [Rhodopseudomonas faecalis]PYF04540.1 thioesterase superfamily protein [Rhodopseudomonas faecalis]